MPDGDLILNILGKYLFESFEASKSKTIKHNAKDIREKRLS